MLQKSTMLCWAISLSCNWRSAQLQENSHKESLFASLIKTISITFIIIQEVSDGYRVVYNKAGYFEIPDSSIIHIVEGGYLRFLQGIISPNLNMVSKVFVPSWPQEHIIPNIYHLCWCNKSIISTPLSVSQTSAHLCCLSRTTMWSSWTTHPHPCKISSSLSTIRGCLWNLSSADFTESY